jgi:ELWxxDGT repeat protein
LELWVSNGTAAGTLEVKGVGGGFGSSGTGAGAIAPINGRFFLQADNANRGPELWQSNGTIGGTTLVQDIDLGKGSYPWILSEVNGNLIVAVNDGALGLELLSGPVPPVPATVKLPKPSTKEAGSPH